MENLPLYLPQSKYSRSLADNIAYGIRKIFPDVFCTSIIHPEYGRVYRISQ